MPIFLINLIVGVVLSIASNLIQQALAPKREQTTQGPRGFRGSVQTGGTIPKSFLVGTIGVPGKQDYPRNSWGTVGGTPNAYLVDVISFGDLPISGFVGLFVNSAPVTVSTTGHVTQGYPVTEYLSTAGADHLWWEFFDGTQTTANGYLTGGFGADADRPWLSDMIGRGVPYLTLTALLNEQLWAGFPSYMAVFQGIPLYDPRKDTTAGGSGLHRWDDQATWEFSDNNLVIAYNIKRGIQYAGERVWGGEAREYQLPYEPWAAAMDRCDELVALDAGGSEKRYRAGREIFFNERPADVIRELLTGANARIAYAGGRYYPLVDIPSEADFEFTDADVIVTEETTLDALPNLDDVINGATATYMEPEQAWEDKETAPYLRSDLVAADDNREQMEGLSLTTTFSGTQAQRVIKETVEESRRFAKHVLPLRPAFGQYRPLQVGAWTSEANQYDGKLFLVTAKTEDRWGRVVFGLQELDPTDGDWDETVDEQPLSFAPLTPIRPAPQPMTGWSVAPYVFPDAADTDRRFGIEIEFAEHLPDVRGVRVQVKENFGDERLIFDSDEYPYDVEEDDPSRVIAGAFLIPNQSYEVRGRFVPISERVTEWSSWLAVTTPNVRLTGDDIDIDALIEDALAGVAESLRWIGDGVRQGIRNFERLGTTLAEQDLANFNDRQVITRELRKKVGDLEASFTEIIEVALGPGGAIATQLESLYAAMGGNTSEVNVRWEAIAAPTGYDASYAVQARVEGEDFDSAAAFGVDVSSTPGTPSRFWVVADQFIVTDGTNDHIPFVFQSGEAIIESVRFKTLSSIAMADVSTPVIVIDGDAGTFSITVP